MRTAPRLLSSSSSAGVGESRGVGEAQVLMIDLFFVLGQGLLELIPLRAGNVEARGPEN